MEVITRQIVKMREERPIKYDFRTYDLIFDIEAAKRAGFHPNFIAMLMHLKSVFIDGMQCRSQSPSSAERLLLETRQVKPTDDQYRLIELAEQAQYRDMSYQQHRLVQDMIFENHEHCFAIEAPLHDDEWSGLVDVLLMHPYEGWVDPQDFKPKAHQDRDAKAQVFRYKRSCQRILIKYSEAAGGTDITLVRGGYFDDSNGYLIL